MSGHLSFLLKIKKKRLYSISVKIKQSISEFSEKLAPAFIRNNYNFHVLRRHLFSDPQSLVHSKTCSRQKRQNLSLSSPPLSMRSTSRYLQTSYSKSFNNSKRCFNESSISR